MPPKQTRKPTRSPAVKQPGAGHRARSISLRPTRPTWERRLKELKAFKKEHGHCNVPAEYSPNQPLANWVANVRRHKRSGVIDAELTRRLDGLGFTWEPNNQKWEDMFADLVAYRAKYGDCNVPSNWSENLKLAWWVKTQRRLRKLNILTQDRLERLDTIGFDWTRSIEAAWESNFAALVEYQRVHGHCRVSTLSKDHANLGSWVRTMRGYRRRGTLSEERIRRLNELGFVWDGRKEPAAVKKAGMEEAWESKYAALVEYQRAYGHCLVSSQPKDHASLARWVTTMRRYRRRGTLSEERIRRLNELGFVWAGRQERATTD